jgi:glucose/arabinose dehydrogenase
MTGSEQVLVEDWCQQYPSHSTGTVEFGPDGALYASGGDGASFNFVDYGQDGSPLNPCGDPPGGVGATLTPPTAEGGALRSQDLRTMGDPTSLDGSVIRVDPTTGAALPDNPLAGSSDSNARRIIAHGMRNPFRFTFRPGTSELWIGDVGWNEWEEINRVLSPTDATVENFGWPCYEGNPRQSGYDAANLNICENLYGSGSADTKPFFAYHHSNQVVPGETCPTGSSSISGISFEFAPLGSPFPAQYQGALFFADYSRDCIWVMKKNGNPIPSPGSIDTFIGGAANPVNIEFGPDGNLYYVDFDGGTIRRIAPEPTTPPPTTTNYLSDLTWTAMTNHCGPAEKDTSFGECPLGDGYALTLNGTTYAKGLGVHAYSDISYNLGGACTRFKASVGLDDEVPAANGSVTFQVWADTTKVFDSGVMNAASTTQTVDVSVAGASQLRVIVDHGATADWDHADWAAARVECGGTDTTPPTVTARTPAPGGTGIAVDISPTATFSEPVDPATVTTSTFFLLPQGSSTPVPAAVSYAGQTATLDPNSNLGQNTAYTATVKGGGSGVKDPAGNPLAADVSWSFTTAASANQPPVPVIDMPSSSLTWKVGDPISFSGHATDPENGALPASALSWTLLMQHCPSNCHSHTIQTWTGVASGSFNAPDHEYPSYLELKLTATDGAGTSATTTLRLDPQTVVLSFGSSPSGLQLAVNGVSSTTPFTRTVIVGSANSLSATSPQSLGGTSYQFASWSDSGAQTHNAVAPAGAVTFTATYSAIAAAPSNAGAPTISGQARVDRTLTASTGTWSGSQPMSFAYQWRSCASTAIGSCTDIAGATSNSYVPVQADIGLRLRVNVTATNTAGSASATSNTTSPVKKS